MKRLSAFILVLLFAFPAAQGAAGEETAHLRVIATSDLHGKFAPWDYALNKESLSGSAAQLSAAIAAYRTPDTLLVDAGDTIQDNFAEIFLGSGVHPMVQALNHLDYDVWVTGNHEYNFGMPALKKVIADMRPKTLAGNVYDADGQPIADGYVILDAGGIRVAVIGMVTPNIIRWDAANLAGCAVTDPLEETRRIIDAIRGQYDVLLGVFHMGIENEYGTPNSGVTDILNACPEFDVMVSSHEHTLIPSMEINGVLVVQNRYMAQTMSVIDLTLENSGDGWRVTDRQAESVFVGGFEPDPEMIEMLSAYDAFARADAESVIGTLEGGPLATGNEYAGIPAAWVRDTALADLINRAQMHYSGARVSAAPLTAADAAILPGAIRKCDIALMYKYTNTLYLVRMNGKQLKRFMEWSVSCFNTLRPGDTAVSVGPGFADYNYFMFEGVCYQVDPRMEPGSRIRDLSWPDGTPVKDTEEFTLAVNNYCASSQLLIPGIICDAEDMPVLLEKDVRGDIGGIRDLIRDYIVSVKGGVITPGCSENWHIVGIE
ncbi:MAG: 5'-nucleotidase C-terminal domain-containing protein [Clostridia bacterium]|nr:5'-nucleotidase C-terminal domain-containing protein [Clostridia bacterium]